MLRAPHSLLFVLLPVACLVTTWTGADDFPVTSIPAKYRTDQACVHRNPTGRSSRGLGRRWMSIVRPRASRRRDSYQPVRLDPFYKKYVSASGYPIVASERVNDYALKEAAFLVDQMLAQRPDVRRAMINSGSRLVVMAHDEYTTDIPEYAQFEPKDFWDARARGLGGSEDDPVCSAAEENLLGFPGDPYSAECILIHEFAHNIHLRGLVRVDRTFDYRLQQAYEAAMTDGLWNGKYAAVNHYEYWAEGVQSWFNNNRPPDHDHNHVDTRRELIEYDPRLARLCREVFRDTTLAYTRPATRLVAHLEGYDPAQAPTFRWPQRLQAAQQEIRHKAIRRNQDAEAGNP